MLFIINCSTIIFTTMLQCLSYNIVMGQIGDEVKNTPLVVLSFDGLTAEMINPVDMPYLGRIRDEGVYAILSSQFYATPFNNHFCIATGICPVEIGIIDKTTNDMKKQEIYERNLKSDTVVPIWTQHERQSKENSRSSKIFMCPMSDLKDLTEIPTHYIKYDKNSKMYNNLEEIITWIHDDKKKSNLLMAYILLKKAYQGHESKVNYTQFVDDLFWKIYEKLITDELEKEINLIVLTCTNINNNIFIASGPMFEKNVKVYNTISLSEVYPLLKHLLNIHEEASEIQSKGEMNELKKVLVFKPNSRDEHDIVTSVEEEKDNNNSHFKLYYMNRS